MKLLCQLSWIASVAVLSASQIVVPTTGAPPGPRTAVIAGQVVDATGAPIAEALVRLALRKNPPSLPTTPGDRVIADREGRFVFADLPAGEYSLQATKDGYADGSYAQRRPLGQSLPVPLSEGERRTDVLLTLWKYAVIAGTVVDEAGEAVVGVGVRALRENVVGGRRRFGGPDVLEEIVSTTLTDDRGMFRLSQLLPGTYVVVVPATQTTLPIGVLDAYAQDTTLRSDLFLGGIAEVAPLGQPRVQQAGDFALLTLKSAVIPPPAVPGGRMLVYPTTFSPAAATAGAASRISVESGEERADLSITLEPVPAVRVAGRLVTPDGSPPPPTSICLAGSATTGVIDSGLLDSSRPATARFEAATAVSDASGRFMLLGVPPGEYVLRHCTAILASAARQGRQAYWISQRLTVGTSDLADVTVDLRPALRVEGRVEFRSSNRQPPTPVPAIAGIVLETPFGEPGRAAAPLREGVFATVAPGGRYFVRPYEISGWFVQSITAGDTDLTDRAFDLQADLTSILVTISDRPSKVSGTVRDTRGAVSPTAVVLAFPVDQDRWSGYGTNPRTLKSAVTTRAGVYTFDNLPPAEYYVVAIDGDTDGWKDPKMLETLAGVATRLTVKADDTAPKTLDLTLKAIR